MNNNNYNVQSELLFRNTSKGVSEILDDILDILQAHTEPHHALSHPGLSSLLEVRC